MAIVENSIDDLIRTAIEHHNAGRIQQAEELYLQVLAERPDDPDVLHLAGLAALQTSRFQLAVDRITAAIAIEASIADFHNHLGSALLSLGRFNPSMDA